MGHRFIRHVVGVTIAALVASLMTVASEQPAAAAVQSGFRGPSYQGFGAESEGGAITGQKPESKLWHQDDVWYASMVSATASGAHTIHRLSGTTWVDTGVAIDPRAASKEDILNTGSKLYVVSRALASSGGAQLRRFSYSGGTYTLDSGFPVAVPGGGAETLTLERDTTGTLWLTFTASSNAMYAYSTGSDTEWSAAAAIPHSQATSLDADDISGIVAFSDATGPAIGIMFSNQNLDSQFFAVHRDSAPSGTWDLETAISGPQLSDDHINLKAGDGRVFAAVKTSASASAEPLIRLLERSPSGAWTKHPVAKVSEQNTRPITMLELDLVTRDIYVFMAMGQGNAGRGISFKRSSIDGIGFPETATTLIEGPAGESISYPTSSKQNATSSSGIVVLASDGVNYWHNTLVNGVVHNPPTADPAATGTSVGVALQIRLTGGDPEDCELEFALVSDPSNGSLGAVNNEPCIAGAPNTDSATVTYTPDPGFSGSDQFSFSADDGGLTSEIAAVDITVASGGIFLRGSSFAENGVDTSVTVPLPAGIQTDDVIIASVDVRGSTTITPPSGWSLIRLDGNGSTQQKATYMKIASGGEGTSITFGLSRNESAVAGILVYAGVDTADPIEAHSGAINGSSSPNLTAPSINISTANTRVIALFGAAADATIEPPAGMTEQGEAAANSGQYDVVGEAADRDQAATGPSGQATATANTSVRSISQQLALRPGVVVPNVSPTANDDTAIVDPGGNVTIDVAANDTDPDGTIDPTSITITSPASQGSTVINPNGTIDYTANPTAAGTDTITYTIDDNDTATSNPATITITIVPNVSPTANDDTAIVDPGGNVTIDVAANDTDPDGTIDPTSITITSPASQGSTVINPNGTIDYTANPTAAGTDTITYTIDDNDTATSNPATITITIVPNVSPTANDDTAIVDPGGNVTIDVAANDTDPDGTIDPTSITITSPASQGSTVINPNGTIDYTANPTAAGTDTITYTIDDNDTATSNPATITITIVPNVSPTANDDTAIVDPGGNVTIDVAANDTDPDGTIDPTSITITSPASQGSTVINPNGTIDYTANPTAAGTDTITYTIDDNDTATSNPATITITIVPNVSPTANDDTAIVDPGGNVTIDVAANDTDPDGTIDPTSITITSPASQGSTVINPNGTIDYTANPTAAGTDTITYTIDDNDTATSNPATITITIVEAPSEITLRSTSEAANQTASTLVIPAPVGTQPGDVLIATIDSRGKPDISAPAGWTLIRFDANANTQRKATFFKVATGSEPTSYTFTLTRTESASGAILAYVGVDTSSPIDTHDATIEQGNRADQLIAPSVVTSTDGSMIITLTGAAANVDIDPAPTTTEWVEITSIGNYDITTHAAGKLQTTAGPTGSFTAISTGSTKYISQTLALRPGVVVPNVSPTANDDTAIVDPGGNVTIDVAANDTDPDGTIDPTSITITSPASQGSTVINPNGTIDYTANPTAAGTDTITYTIDDNDTATSNPATITITIVPNVSPTANDDTAIVDPGGNVTIDVAANDTDPDGTIDPTSITITSPASQGSTVINPNGTIDYTANPTAAGTDTITYTIDDNDTATSNPATITITIVPNVSPTANDDTAIVDPGGNVTIDVAANDTDPDGTIDPTSITITSPASQGSTVINPNGTIDYTANPTAAGTDTITYTIDDNDTATSNPATITITIVEAPSEITLRSTSEAANQTASTLVIPAPVGTQPGDVLIATIDSRGKPDISAPAGWTLIRFDANANTQRKATFFKVATGSEPTSYTFTLTRTESASGAILAYVGVDTSSPIDTHDATIEQGNRADQLIAPSVVTSTDGSMIITLTGAAANVDIDPAPTTTEWVEITSIGNYDITTHAAGKLQTTAGPTGSFTAISTGSTKYISQTLALRPAS